MNKKMKAIEKFIVEGNAFLGKNLTFEDGKFIAWNNAVIRFMEKNYGVDSTTTKIFKERDYSPPVYCECSHQYFVKRFEDDLKISIEDLKRLLEEIEYEEEITIKTGNNNVEFTAVEKVLQLIKRFHLVAKQLKCRHGSRKTIEITDEYDVQDLFHALLRIYFDDIRPEEYTPSYAGKCTRQDFLLKDENIVIEIKKTRNGLTDKEIGDQLINDIAHYKTHQNCKTLICFVYDSEEKIKNPIGLEKDLSSDKELNVIVKIIQK